jgi:RNA polymerase sigma-70 factor, ECF subfamily
MKDEPTDHIVVLTRGLAAGDEASFREFHRLYFDPLYRFLLVVTRGNPHAAQEALQHTLLRVAKHARSFESDEVFWGWLKIIARNAARDGARKDRRYSGLLHKYLVGSAEGARLAAGEEWRDHLEAALAELDPEDRGLVQDKYLHGASVAELATSTGLTEKAVESRLLRLRRSLAERILLKLRQP